ncbi:hypothetical protein ABC977_17440 [Thioalkalicoccus limnaeus]|uniref:GNAT family acetyltransferase n=1 Tax=Thioalkalicoccus limnaeus TaxID=120681 RepID=A0ABV4BK81_9GAMM
MKRTSAAYHLFSRVIYALASIALTLISIAMIVVAGLDVWDSARAGEPLTHSMLDGIGLVVVSLAVLDVAKYLMEEEVLRDRELRSATEARKTLTKFLVIIIIALTLEALVFVFKAGSEDLTLLIYPAALLAMISLMVVALAFYMRISSKTEKQLGDDDVSLPES